jgi:hypothetical protein
MEIAAVILLLVGGIVVPVIGWIVGCILLWVSPRWSRGDKLLGTLVWPGGLLAVLVAILGLAFGAETSAGSCSSIGSSSSVSSNGVVHQGPVVTHCTSPAIPPWLAITLAVLVLVAAFVGPVLVAVRLLIRARSAPGPTMTEEPQLVAG